MENTIWVVKGKHGQTIFNAKTMEDMQASALKILKMHLEMGYYYDEEKVQAENILKNEDGSKARFFVWNRSYLGHEYEEIYQDSF